MKRILTIIAILFTVASYGQNAVVLPSIAKLKTFSGRATQVIVTDVNTGGLFSTSADINEETADEFDIYAGAGGRKWKRVSKIGPPDSLYVVKPVKVRPRSEGMRVDTLEIKLDTPVYQPVPLAAYFAEGTNITLSGAGTVASPITISSSGSGGVADPGANGFMARTSLNTTAARTLTGTTNRITITNTTGGGNPVWDIGSDVATLSGTQTFTGAKTVAANLIVSGSNSRFYLYDQNDGAETGIYRNSDNLIFNSRQDNLSFREVMTFSLAAPADGLRLTSNGYLGVNVGSSPTAFGHFAAATTGAASIRLTSSAGTNPSSPNSGDLWWNGTNLNFRTGSSTVDLLAGGGSGVSTFNGRSGTVTPATDDYTWAQINKATSSLADITTRSAADLSSGTLPDARLSSNVVTLTGSQTLTGKTLTTPLIAQINGGTAAGSGIILRATTGNANTSSFIDFQTGNNGALRAMRINNAGTVHIGAGTPAATDILYVGKTTGYDPIGAFETTVSDGFAMFGMKAPSSIWNFGTASTTSSYQNLGGTFFVYDKTNELAAMVIDRSGYKMGIGGITQPTAYLHAPASTTSYASVRMPHGSAPTSPNNGDFWTTTAGAYVQVNGATYKMNNDSSGTYSPTVSGSGPNVDGVTAAGFKFTRIGNIVDVSGRLTVDLAGVFSGGLVPINISLPQTSALANVSDVTGEVNAVSNSASNNAAGWVEADAANDRATASIYIPAGSTDPRDLIVRFRYIIQ